MHAADKVIFVNPIHSRLDLLRQVDGIYTEYGHDRHVAECQRADGPPQAGAGLDLQRDAPPARPRLLHAAPSAPGRLSDGAVSLEQPLHQPEPSADKLYLDYGPLLDAMRGKKWVLAPHCVECAAADVKVNLFQVPGGYVVPVTFGKGSTARIVLRNMAGMEHARFEAIQPGEKASVPIRGRYHDGLLELSVPLKRGCAMVRITTDS